jgi:hypothetical protein
MVIWIKALELLLYFVNKWSKDEQLKAKLAADILEARKKYYAGGSGEASKIKQDYDQLQDDLKNGKWKV